jgi:WhiB family transcriptional regulator, redox-sensing transcriptional regulator
VAIDYRPTEHGAESEGSPFSVFEALEAMRPAWHRGAACRGLPQHWWWPEANAEEDRARAKEVCSTCRVQSLCLQYGLEHAQEVGILGGLTERERKRLRKNLRLGAAI